MQIDMLKSKVEVNPEVLFFVHTGTSILLHVSNSSWMIFWWSVSVTSCQILSPFRFINAKITSHLLFVIISSYFWNFNIALILQCHKICLCWHYNMYSLMLLQTNALKSRALVTLDYSRLTLSSQYNPVSSG